MNIEDFTTPPSRELNLDEAFAQIQLVDQVKLRASLANFSYQDFLATTYWRCVAKTVKDRDGNHCKVCNGRQQLCAHHRHYMPRGTEHLHMADLTTLCDPCHKIFHENGRVDGSRLLKPRDEPKKKKKKRIILFARDRRALRARLAEKQKEIVDRWKNGPPPISQPPEPIIDGVVLTWELVDACKRNGAFTAATTGALGVVNMEKGWARRLVGMTVSKEQYAAALAGREVTKTRIGVRNGSFINRDNRMIYSP